MFILPKQSRFPEGYILYSFPSCVKPAHLFDLNNVKNPACAPVWKQRHVIQLMIQKTAYVLTPSSFITDVLSHMQQVVIIFLLYDTAGPTVQLCFTQFVVVVSRNVWPYRAGGIFFFWKEQRAAVPRVCRHRAFDSASAFSAPLLFAVFVWCYFSRKRQTPLSSGSAVLLRAIHACCRAHRVKHNKGRPLFTSGTNHPDGTSINPPPCRQWLECTYVWPWTIQMRQRQIEWGCTEAIFSLARWPVSCSRLLSPPHLLLVMCQQLGWVSQLYLLGALSCRPTFVPPQTDVLPTLTCLLEDPATHSSAPLRVFFLFFFSPSTVAALFVFWGRHRRGPRVRALISLFPFSWKVIRFRLVVWSRCITTPHTEACFCSCLI